MKARAAGLVFAVAAGWLAHDAIGLAAGPAQAAPTFIEEAVTSHKTTDARGHALPIRQPEASTPARSAGSPALTVPQIPTAWLVSDVQIYPPTSAPSSRWPHGRKPAKRSPSSPCTPTPPGAS